MGRDDELLEDGNVEGVAGIVDVDVSLILAGRKADVLGCVRVNYLRSI